MLPRVLLHVVAAAAPIDVAAHRRSGQQQASPWCARLSPLLVLFYRKNGRFELMRHPKR